MSPLDCALRYAARDWHVFPLVPNTKRPATRNGFHDATTDPDQIRAWWTSTPTAGIGMPTGISFDVLDIDHTDWVTGVADLPDCETQGGPIVRTGSGKWHVYLLPTGHGRTIRRWQHCDWLGTDGYVIAPPSIHADTGRAYEWFAPPDLTLTAAPTELVEALSAARTRASQPSETVSAISAPRSAARVSGARTWSPAGLIGRVASAAPGTRNDALNWAAFRLGEDARAGKAPRDEAGAAADELVRVAVLNGLDEREAISTVRSGYGRGIGGAG